MSSSFCYAILSGGRSVQMGQDKSLLVADGASIIERIVDDIRTFANTCDKLLICSGEKRDAQLSNQNFDYLDDYLTDYQCPLSGQDFLNLNTKDGFEKALQAFKHAS